MRIWWRRTRAAARTLPEYELLDTGIFAEDRYFDVFVEYAQAEPGDILMQDHGVQSRSGGRTAASHSATGVAQYLELGARLATSRRCAPLGDGAIGIEPAELGASRLYVDGAAELLFTENETNAARLWNVGAAGYFKDGFHERIVDGAARRV